MPKNPTQSLKLTTKNPLEQLLFSLASDNTNTITDFLHSLNHINPAEFFILAQEHGVAPLITYHLKKRNVYHLLPLHFQKIAGKTFYSSTAKNLMILYELKKILNALSERKIEPIFIKGISYILSNLYPHIGLRPLTDIDLLVKDSDLTNAQDTLTMLGYQHQIFPNFPPGFQPAPQYLYLNTKFTPFPIFIDLHTRLSAYKRFGPPKMEEIWSRAELCNYEDLSCQILSPIDAILFGTIHLATHRFYLRQIWFYDLFLLIQKAIPSWSELWTRAREWKCTYPLIFTLYLMSKYFPFELPTPFRPSTLPLIRQLILTVILQKQLPLKNKTFKTHRCHQLFNDFITQESFHDFLKLLARYGTSRAALFLHRLFILFQSTALPHLRNNFHSGTKPNKIQANGKKR